MLGVTDSVSFQWLRNRRRQIIFISGQQDVQEHPAQRLGVTVKMSERLGSKLERFSGIANLSPSIIL